MRYSCSFFQTLTEMPMFVVVLLLLNMNTSQCVCHTNKNIFLAGIEGSMHHGISILIPELNKLAFDSNEVRCCDVEWTSYPSKGSKMNENTRISLVYGDSCHAFSSWKSDCGSKGVWRCGDDPEDMYEELLFRFATWQNFLSLTSHHFGGFRFLVLRRDFVRSVMSHTQNTHPWDGHFKSHALVMAVHTTLLSAMLAKKDPSQWVSINPDYLSDEGLRVIVLRSLLMWCRWPLKSTQELEGMLSKVWHASTKVPDKLQDDNINFVTKLMAARRSDGSWAAYEDPNQMLLFQYQKMEDTLIRQHEIDATGAPPPIIDNTSIPSYLLNESQLDSFKLEAQAAMQGNQDYDLNFRQHSSKQSVSWPFPKVLHGPFPHCTPPEWALIDKTFPRDNELNEQ